MTAHGKAAHGGQGTTGGPGTPWVLWIIPAVYFVFVAAEFGAMTYLALQATAAGRSALAVGGLSSAMWTGILLASARSHGLVARHGHARVIIAATGLSLLALSSMPWHQHYAGWLAGALVLGLGGGLVWVAGEAWLAELAPPARRGYFVGLFETAVGLGLMAGPALLPLALWLQWPLLWVSTGLMAVALACSLPLARVAAQPVDDVGVAETGAVALAAWRAVAWPLAGVAVLSGMMESGVSALLPSVSMRLGFSMESAAWLGTVIGAGSALLQPPAGHLADRWGVRRSVLLAWGLVLLANAVLLLWADQPDRVLWGVGFALAGVGGAAYTLMIVALGHQLAGSALVKAIALLVTGYALGTSVGPVLGGAAFDVFGLRGLATLLLALGMLGGLATWRWLKPAGGPVGGPAGAPTAAGRDQTCG